MGNEDLFGRGMKLRELHKFKAAAKLFHEIREINPNFSEASFWEAVSLDNGGIEKRDIPCYMEAIRLGLPDSLLPKAYLWLSSSLSIEGDIENAERTLKMAEQIKINYDPGCEFEFISGKIKKRIARTLKKRS